MDPPRDALRSGRVAIARNLPVTDNATTHSAVLRLCVTAITLALLLPCFTSSVAAASEQQICDVNADLALGLEDYPTAIALHRIVLRAHNEDALAHYHLGFAYGMTGRTRDESSQYLAATKLGLRKWDLFLNLGIAYMSQNDWPKR
jgi:Flp pilus assembly protein TadD